MVWMGPLGAELLKYGPAGLAIAVLGAVIKVLWDDNKLLQLSIRELQGLRLADANTAATRLLDISKEAITALNRSSASQEASQTALREFEDALRDMERNR